MEEESATSVDLKKYGPKSGSRHVLDFIHFEIETRLVVIIEGLQKSRTC